MNEGALRAVLVAAVLAVVFAVAWFGAGRGAAGDGSVTVYSSADGYVAEAIGAAFEASSSLPLSIAGDTEATKTFGLVQRLRSEAATGARADVWWSSEPFATIAMAQDGLFEPHGFELEGWPVSLASGDGVWIGFGSRARVIVHAPDRTGEPPRSLQDMLDPEHAGRWGIARPEFGTTRGHFAALIAMWGEQRFVDWLGACVRNGMRVYSGNADVVRAVAMGEIDFGLTDTDDVYAAQANGDAVELVRLYDEAPEAGLPMSMPNTAALVRGGPNRAGGEAFLRHLISAESQRVLAESDSRNEPVDPALRAEFAAWIVEGPSGWAWPSLEEVAARLDDVPRLCGPLLDR